MAESRYDDTPQDELMSALSVLQLGGKYSDLLVRCNHRTWAVHRAILCPRSDFFDAACSADFTQEAQSGVIDLSNDDEDAVDHMINYFYRLDYPKASTSSRSCTRPSSPLSRSPEGFRKNQLSLSYRRQPRCAKLDLSAIEDPLFAQAQAALDSACAIDDSSKYLSPKASPTRSTPPFLTHRHDSSLSIHLDTKKAESRFPDPVADHSSQVDHNPKVELRQNLDTATDDDDAENETKDEDERTMDDSAQQKSDLLMHVRVHALADKYSIQGLKDLATRKFKSGLACHLDSPDFADAIEEVYDVTRSCDRALRDIVVEAFRIHPRLATSTDVYKVIQSVPDLALELWKTERGIPLCA